MLVGLILVNFILKNTYERKKRKEIRINYLDTVEETVEDTM